MGRNTVGKLVTLSIMLSLIVISAIGIIDSGNSSADVDYTRYYYNQLEYNFEKNAYNKIKNIKDFEIDEDSKSKCVTISVRVDDPYLLIFLNDTEKIKRCVERVLHAAMFDMPLNTYFFHKYSLVLHCSPPELDIKLIVANDYSEKTKEWYDQRVIHQIDNMSAGIDKLATIPDKIIAIHTYVIDTLSYDHDNCDINLSQDSESYNVINRVRSVYNAFVGDHRVVCEGYAKMFKVLCDRCNVPCIIVTSDKTVDNDQQIGHMWNYVYIDNSWYIVDCTWDDGNNRSQTKVSTEYLMSGADELHQPGSDMNFKVPALSLDNYGSWMVTFVSDDVELFKTVSRHGIISEPSTPEKTGKTFMYWYTDDEDEPFDFCSSVATNTILKAKWTEKPVFKIVYDSMGGSNINCTVVTQDDPTGHVTKNIPEKEKSVFKGWNDSPTGNGEWFEANDKVEMQSDMRLYAIWETKENTTINVTNTLNVGLIDAIIICNGILCISAVAIIINK